jgi:heme-degrading monooxygenase HmoA
MILELAILTVRPGEAAAFEAAFRDAQQIIAQTPGHQRHELRRCLEAENRYVLLVWWDTVASHTEGFRGSARYAEWRQRLHPFYDPAPTVEHYGPVAGAVSPVP